MDESPEPQCADSDDLGLWIVVRLVASFSDSEQQWLRYVAGGITLLYLLFVMLSWLGSSLANLFY